MTQLYHPLSQGLHAVTGSVGLPFANSRSDCIILIFIIFLILFSKCQVPQEMGITLIHHFLYFVAFIKFLSFVISTDPFFFTSDLLKLGMPVYGYLPLSLLSICFMSVTYYKTPFIKITPKLLTVAI